MPHDGRRARRASSTSPSTPVLQSRQRPHGVVGAQFAAPRPCRRTHHHEFSRHASELLRRPHSDPPRARPAAVTGAMRMMPATGQRHTQMRQLRLGRRGCVALRSRRSPTLFHDRRSRRYKERLSSLGRLSTVIAQRHRESGLTIIRATPEVPAPRSGERRRSTGAGYGHRGCRLRASTTWCRTSISPSRFASKPRLPSTTPLAFGGSGLGLERPQ